MPSRWNDRPACLAAALVLVPALLAAGALPTGLPARARWARAPLISEVYGGGGNSGAAYTHDFIELYNPTAEPVSLDGWSVQYAPARGSFSATRLTSLEGSIPAFGSFLIQGAAGSSGEGSPLPPPDVDGSLNLAAASGQVALARSTDAVTGLDDPNLVDLVGYGSAEAFEGEEPAPRGSNTRSVQRRADGGAEPGSGTGSGWDTDQNGQDFVAAPPSPRARRDPPEPPAPPVAVIRAARTVEPGAQVELDGSGSWDPGGDPLAYRWRLVQVPAGSVAALDDPTAPRAAFTADQAGGYAAELTVSDGLRESAPARAEVVASAAASAPDALITHGPNPARDRAVFLYRGGQAATLLVFAATGARVHRADLAPGPVEHAWDLTTPAGRPVAPGLYLYLVLLADGGRSPLERLAVER